VNRSADPASAREHGLSIETDQLKVELQGSVLVLTLNRPEKKNAITHEMVAAWAEQLVKARTDDAVRVIVVTGSGDAFCSGADFSMMRANRQHQPEQPRGLESFVHRIAVALEDLDKPVLAAINGPAVGAGLGMALMTDIRFMADTARVAEGYINVGIFPGDGDTYYLPRLIGTARALEMFWTGDFWSAQECLDWGVVNRVFPAAELMERTMAFAQRLTTRPQAAIRTVKRATYAARNMNLRDSLGMIASYSQMVSSSPDRREAFEAFVAAHPTWKVETQ